MTQDDLEEKSGVDRTRISRLETDPDANPTFDTIQKLEAALGVKPGSLRFGPRRQGLSV